MVKDPLTGRLVDSRYEIVDRVARGGMATVYRAHDRRLDRVVGLKLMHAHLADSPDFVARFRREARAAARLSNPGVVAVYDQGSLDGVAYLIMEYVEGPNLRDLMAAGPLSVREALGLTAQILRPLGAAHRAGRVRPASPQPRVGDLPDHPARRTGRVRSESAAGPIPMSGRDGICCATSPSAVREKGAQRRVRRRGRGKGAQQTARRRPVPGREPPGRLP